MRGNHRTQCRIFKRCLLFFAAISLLPFALIYLISTDQFYRIKSYDVSIQFYLTFLMFYQYYDDYKCFVLTRKEHDMVKKKKEAT